MTDDQIKALAAAGGALGIAFAPAFVHSDPRQATIDRSVEHIRHVGILSVSNRGKVPVVPEVSQPVHLTRSMLAHGLSEGEIQKVWGGNFLASCERTSTPRAQNGKVSLFAGS
ncbi:MAG: membrane dipeptidase [Acidobacteria bacterium]|nr:membrane dipeptidase [Acidobacteriota bacterium]